MTPTRGRFLAGARQGTRPPETGCPGPARSLPEPGRVLACPPWLLGTGQDTGSTQSAIVSGAVLVWAALWALMSRQPAPAHAMVMAIGGWLLLAPSLWYFAAAAASWNSIATGLAAIALSGSVPVTGPWTRPPLDADKGP